VSDEVRLLGKTGGYTEKPTHALRVTGEVEPEAVDRQTQRRITAEAVRDWPHMNALQTASRESRPLHQRIANVKAQAKHARIDVYQPMRLLENAVMAGRSHAHVERRVEVLESLVFPQRQA
jgi:hypothetical protein